MISSLSSIHPTAIIHDGAVIEDHVIIGPYCIIGPHVNLKQHVHLVSQATIDGHTTIGSHTKIYPFACLGFQPQDLKYHGEKSSLMIGSYNVIREYVTIHPGTQGGGMVTTVGDHCLFMVSVHIAHDCYIGNHVIMSNQATLAGHVHVGNHVIIGGLSAVRQFVRIGDYAFIGGMCGVANDIPPYAMITENKSHLSGINAIGMKRHHFSNDFIMSIKKMMNFLFNGSQDQSKENNMTFQEKLIHLKAQHEDSPEFNYFFKFLLSDSILQYTHFPTAS
jgi:UDP-N-acetylglucosamine acyltransferase